MGENPDALAQEQAEGRGGERREEKVPIGSTAHRKQAQLTQSRDEGPEQTAIRIFTAQIL